MYEENIQVEMLIFFHGVSVTVKLKTTTSLTSF